MHRIIGVIILENSKVVQTNKYEITNIIHSDPIFATAKMYEGEIDELVIIDKSKKATVENSLCLYERILENIFIPVSIAANIRSTDDIDNLFLIGVERVIMNSCFWNRNKLYEYTKNKYGMQAVLPAIEYKSENGFIQTSSKGKQIMSDTIHNTLESLEEKEFTELLLMPIDHDGKSSGPEHYYSNVFAAKGYQTILYGSITNQKDIIKSFEIGHSSVAISNALHYQDNFCYKLKYDSMSLNLLDRLREIYEDEE